MAWVLWNWLCQSLITKMCHMYKLTDAISTTKESTGNQITAGQVKTCIKDLQKHWCMKCLCVSPRPSAFNLGLGVTFYHHFPVPILTVLLAVTAFLPHISHLTYKHCVISYMHLRGCCCELKMYRHLIQERQQHLCAAK